MARTAIPLVIISRDSNVQADLFASGVELNDAGSHGGPDGTGYYLTNPSGRSVLCVILDDGSRSQGTLTLPTQPVATNTMTIDAKVFTFRAIVDWDTNGEIPIGLSLAATQASIVAAINGTDGVNTAHTTVRAQPFASNVMILTAIEGGAGGDSIVTTETLGPAGDVFDGATLGTFSAGDLASLVTVTAFAVEDPYGRGGPTSTPTYDLIYSLTTGSGPRILPLGAYTPLLYNQSGDVVNIDVTALTGTGKLVAVSI